jgi:hypothetical protein
MAYGNGPRTVGKQGTLDSLGLDMASKRRKSRPLKASEQADIQTERRMDLQQRAEMQGKMGTDIPTGDTEQARTKRKNVKKAKSIGDAAGRQGIGPGGTY